MRRAVKKCASCPFRNAAEDYKRACAHIPAGDWPCHTEDLHGDYGIQCRGHWQARHKYGHLIGPQATDYDLTPEGRAEARAVSEIE